MMPRSPSLAAKATFNFNVYKPVMIHNVLESADLIADGCDSMRLHCATGIAPNLARIQHHLDDSLMLVTALNTHIGYENAAKIAKKAHADGSSLKEAAVSLRHAHRRTVRRVGGAGRNDTATGKLIKPATMPGVPSPSPCLRTAQTSSRLN